MLFLDLRIEYRLHCCREGKKQKKKTSQSIDYIRSPETKIEVLIRRLTFPLFLTATSIVASDRMSEIEQLLLLPLVFVVDLRSCRVSIGSNYMAAKSS